MLRIFRNICLAVRQLHCYELPEVPARRQENNNASTDAYGRISYEVGDADDADQQTSERRVVYAHRDIKLGYIFANKYYTCILIDND
jgi:hypothetical protein